MNAYHEGSWGVYLDTQGRIAASSDHRLLASSSRMLTRTEDRGGVSWDQLLRTRPRGS